MKSKITLILFFVFAIYVQGQKRKFTFEKDVKIGQSMETSEEKVEPAQLQLTISEDKKPSYLINIGSAVTITPNNNIYISKIKIEYHRNTLIDEEQNNIEIGYQATWNFKTKGDMESGSIKHFLVFDPKYVYDAIKEKNSIASNILYSWYNNKNKIHWNTNNYIGENERFIIFPSIYLGAQMQQILKAADPNSEGFILRPMSKINVSINLTKKEKFDDPMLSFSSSYTSRFDAINSTNYKEHYTDLLKTGFNYYFFTKDSFEVSLGASYNYGSDPLAGLNKQSYYLLSLNVSKK